MATEVTEFTVELRPQTILTRTCLGEVRVPVHQSQVVVNGKVVAHVCDHDGAPVNFCELSIPTALRGLIVEQVAKLRGQVATRPGGAPPDPDTVASMIRDLNHDDDSDDDEDGDDDDGLDAIG